MGELEVRILMTLLLFVGCGIVHAQDEATITVFDGSSLVIVADDMPAGVPTREGITTHADAHPMEGVVMFAGGTDEWMLVQAVLLTSIDGDGPVRSHLHTLQLSLVPQAMLQITATVPTDLEAGQRQFSTSAGGVSGAFTGLTSRIDGERFPISAGRGFFGGSSFDWETLSSGMAAEGTRIVSEVLVGHAFPDRSGVSLDVREE